MHTWLLPEYIEDVLPPEAQRIENTRRRLLDLFRSHGYQLVMPPLLEYVESLLTGTGHEMDIKTFKLVDQLSGRLMGVRADITPQVARIDAHLLNRQGVTRLCYAGSVLHTVPGGQSRTREPLQVGAELYGHPGVESDIEIQQLMLSALRLAGVENLHLDLGHVAIFRSLVRAANLPDGLESELFQVLQAKDVASLRELVKPLDALTRDALTLLPELYGGMEMLDEAQRRLPSIPEITQALTDLRRIGEQVQKMGVGSMCFDLADLRGYHYHSGVVFAAYAKGWSNAIALGGRYDEVGKAFGRARPATGFSMDLREISAVMPAEPLTSGVLAPCVEDAALQNKIEALRRQGEIVVVDLPGHEAHRAELGCDRALVLKNGIWEVQ
jgi:ATP phosphoribosyltransferase regulatory subunit